MKNKADSKPEHKFEMKGDSKHVFSNRWEVKCSIGKGALSLTLFTRIVIIRSCNVMSESS